MIAVAMLEGAEEIAVMGVNMAWNEEYSEQRPSCEYMLGRAMESGIRVHIPDVSDLLKAGHLYAFESPPDVQRRLESKLSTLKRDIKIREHEEKQSGDDKLTLQGELKAVEYTLRHL